MSETFSQTFETMTLVDVCSNGIPSSDNDNFKKTNIDEIDSFMDEFDIIRARIAKIKKQKLIEATMPNIVLDKNNQIDYIDKDEEQLMINLGLINPSEFPKMNDESNNIEPNNNETNEDESNNIEPNNIEPNNIESNNNEPNIIDNTEECMKSLGLDY